MTNHVDYFGRPKRPQKVDVTGRSTGTKRRGKIKTWSPETPFIGHSKAFRKSPAFRKLTTPARHVLDFLELEHLQHGGQENGNLAAPYRQLQKWGISSRDISQAFGLLMAAGFIRRTDQNDRLGGRKAMATYRLTYVPSMDGRLPTDEWRKVTYEEMQNFLSDLSALLYDAYTP